MYMTVPCSHNFCDNGNSIIYELLLSAIVMFSVVLCTTYYYVAFIDLFLTSHFTRIPHHNSHSVVVVVVVFVFVLFFSGE